MQRTPAAYALPDLRPPAPGRADAPRGPAAAALRAGRRAVFAVVGLVGYLSGLTLLGAVATGFALVAALLNAVFGLCLGCELYLLIQRVTHRTNEAKPTPAG